MNDPSKKSPDVNKPRPYEVGYGKPPVHTRFPKGVSGNPRGGSGAQRAARAKKLALKEAYRLVTVREGDEVMTLPAIQAVLRSQIALAVKGNGPAQRALIAAVHALEQERAMETAVREQTKIKPTPYTEVARRIALVLRLAAEEKKKNDADNASAGPIEHDKAKTGHDGG
ncbi:MAG TPA: DUF5681 domain-containing protein [Xanthobacteraceae bacterium]|nr:DUF5681 domain-containing protein [Xanthobacteraceae bacterium]